MADEQTDQEQTQQIGALTERLARLELALKESPITRKQCAISCGRQISRCGQYRRMSRMGR